MVLSPELIKGSFVLMIIIYVVAFVFQVYVLYLNWKQSKVNDQMAELINEVKLIRKELNNKNKK